MMGSYVLIWSVVQPIGTSCVVVAGRSADIWAGERALYLVLHDLSKA